MRPMFERLLGGVACWLVASLVQAAGLGDGAAALAASGASAAPRGLVAALQATLAQHPAIAGKRAEVAAKSYAAETARTQRYPSLSALASASDNGYSPVTLQVKQPLWTFGRIDASIGYADADQAVDQADLLNVQRDLIERTAVAYAQVRLAQRHLEIAEDNVAALTELTAKIQRREQGELASQADVNLAQARLVQAQAQRDRYQGDIAVALNELQALTQTAVDTGAVLAADVTALPDEATLQQQASQVAAAVLVKQRRVALAERDVARQKTAAMPTVYLQGEQVLNDNTRARNSSVGVMLQASMDNLGFASRGLTQAALERARAARQDLNATQTELRRKVHSLLANRSLQQGLINNLKDSVLRLQDLLASYQRQYTAGTRNWLDVLNMQRELYEQRQQAAQAASDWTAHSLRLAALCGLLDDKAGVTGVNGLKD